MSVFSALPRLVLAFGLFLAPRAEAQPVAARIQAHIQNPRFQAAQWGIHVVSLDTGRILFRHNSGKYFIPASNAKLFTCALALCRLGPEARIRTSVYAAAKPGPGGALKGDLVFFGRGDPLLLARWRGGHSLPDPLEALALQVAASGVRVIEGDIAGDDSFFPARTIGSGWEAGDRNFAFGADVSALTVHDNMVDLRVYPGTAKGRPCFLFPMPGKGILPLRNLTTTGKGLPIHAEWTGNELVVTGSLPEGAAPTTQGLPVRDPALFAARLLRRALERHGITVKGGCKAIHAQDRPAPLAAANLAELGHVDSPPMRDLVKAALKDSVNLYAQLLLLQVGGSEEGGIAELGVFLKEAGIKPGGALMEEGTGLSRKDLIKPEAITGLLRYMRGRSEFEAFEDALPVAAVDGTLRDRMGGTQAAVNFRAKTGTLRYTHALSGYLTTSRGEHLVVAIMLNNYLPPGEDAPSPQAELDAIAVLLAE